MIFFARQTEERVAFTFLFMKRADAGILIRGDEQYQVVGVEIEGVDRQACGGTHVKNTGEIGKIKMIKAENKGKANRRVYFSLED